MNKIDSGRLQDIEATIKIVKSKSKLKFIYKFGVVPYLLLKYNITDKQWLKILYYEREEEIRRIKFWNELIKELKEK